MSQCLRWFLLWVERAFPLLGFKLPGRIHSEAAENSTWCFTDSERGEAAPLALWDREHGDHPRSDPAPLYAGEALAEGWSPW